MDIKIKSIFSHVLLWVFYLINTFFVYWLLLSEYPFVTYLIETLIGLPLIMGTTYIVLYVVIPRLERNNNYIFLLLWVLILILIVYAIEELLFRYLWGLTTFGIFLETGIVVFVTLTVFLSKNWLNTRIEKEKIEKERVKAELAALKSQVHPHFLFNIMNNIYSNVLRNEMDKAAYGLEYISKLLSKVLYENNESRVSIVKEIEMIDIYLKLQKYRYQDGIELDFKCEIDEDSLELPPMVLFTFVENCFKHGGNIIGEKNFIQIHISTIRKKIYLKTENGISDVFHDSGGKGIESVLKRLELIYGDSYKLKAERLEDRFKVELTINTDNDAENKMYYSG